MHGRLRGRALSAKEIERQISIKSVLCRTRGVLARHTQMRFDGVFDGAHVCCLKRAELSFEAGFVCCHDLVGHRLVAFAVYRHQSFARIGATSAAGGRHNHDSGQISVGCVIADNHRWPRLCDLGADRWVELDPPDFTAFHGSCLWPVRCTTVLRQLRAPGLLPWLCSHHPTRW